MKWAWSGMTQRSFVLIERAPSLGPGISRPPPVDRQRASFLELGGPLYLQVSEKWRDLRRVSGIAVKGVSLSDPYYLRFVAHGPRIACSG